MSFFFFFAFIHFSFTEIDIVYKFTYCCLLIRLFFFLLLSISHLQKLAIFIQQSYFFFFNTLRVSDSIRFASVGKFTILILRFLLFSLWYFKILRISYCIAWFFDAFQISNLDLLASARYHKYNILLVFYLMTSNTDSLYLAVGWFCICWFVFFIFCFDI